ncbi:MAG: MotA/TolQ/ExbB proton channel family protein [Kiritimatiellia bacterium]|nr:MotA/TolQ/ExbB proton channel family protein [Kiritimatiellia bacterium]
MKLNTVKLLAALAAVLVIFGGELFMPSDPGCGNDFFITAAFAQAPAPAGGGAETLAGPPETLGDYWVAAGVTRWPLLAVAVWITALVIELSVRAREKAVCPPEAVSQLSSTLAVKDYVKAWQYCADNPSPLTRAMMPAIEFIPKGLNAVTDTSFDVINLQNNVFKTKCSYLNLHATVSTLLGLFGTITGMMGAFNKMAYSGATGDPSKLAGSISEALVTTWIGLALAISALALFYVFTNRTKAVIASLQNTVTKLIGEIDFNLVTPDMEIITAEMKARTMGGKGGVVASAAPDAPAAPAKADEMAQCPNCQYQVKVGAAKCPNCNNELEWE